MLSWSDRTAVAVCLLLGSFAYGQDTNGVKSLAEFDAGANGIEHHPLRGLGPGEAFES